MDPDQVRHFVKTVYGGFQRSSLFSVKTYGSRSRPTFCWAGSGSKFVIKVSACYELSNLSVKFLLFFWIQHGRHIFFRHQEMYSGPFCEKNSIRESFIILTGCLENGVVLEHRTFLKKSGKSESLLPKILTLLEPHLSSKAICWPRFFL